MNREQPGVDHSSESGLDPSVLFADATKNQPGEKPLNPDKFGSVDPEIDQGVDKAFDIIAPSESPVPPDTIEGIQEGLDKAGKEATAEAKGKEILKEPITATEINEGLGNLNLDAATEADQRAHDAEVARLSAEAKLRADSGNRPN
ncbi:MAG: hypothetical protein Q8P20_05150 [bacterium]|nr:hypothetical protein [bacterium]